jgi:hypothetical protein
VLNSVWVDSTDLSMRRLASEIRSSIKRAPSGDTAEVLGREHQARGRTRSRPRL